MMKPIFLLLTINLFYLQNHCYKISPLDVKDSFINEVVDQEHSSHDIKETDIFSDIHDVKVEEEYTGPDECLHFCNSEIIGIVKTALSLSMKISEKYESICSDYQVAKSCMEKRPQCPSQKFFITSTSGIKYMCEEQKNAFDHNIHCINDWFQYSNYECETICMASNLINGLSLKKMFQQDFRFLEMFDPYVAKISVNEMCRVGECMLLCYKQKLDTRCDGVAGSILAEAVLRPIADIQAVTGPITPMVSSVIPMKCAFLHDAQHMSKLRIDDNLNKEIATKYRLQKELPKEKNNKDDVPDIPDPFISNPDKDSPLGIYDEEK
uniref:CPG4 domain-containing protein n=1 Tax=Parastrongyloides trichosuri TaxID=131310 RepID=A0A0N4ZUB7_PARTI